MNKILSIFTVLILTYPFAIKAEGNNKITIAAMGDIADCRASQEGGVQITSKILLEQKVDMFLPLGDLVYPEASSKEMHNCYGKYFSYIKKITYPTVGNHEYYSDNAENYLKYFQLNKDILDKETNSTYENSDLWPKYYRFDRGSWTFISIDTNKQGQFDNRQINWLKETYKSKKKCTIIMMHHPYISKGLRPIAEEAKIVMKEIRQSPPTLILTGHDHHYQESSVINGTRHYVIGSGGVKINNFVNPLNLDTEYSSFNHGLLILDLYDNKYKTKFISKEGIEKETEGVCNE